MASLTNLLTIVILGSLAISSSARPCKTLFIASYSISFKPAFTQENSNFISSDPNPNLLVDQKPLGYVTIFSSYSDVLIARPYFRGENGFLPQFEPHQHHHHQGLVDDGNVGVGPFGTFDSLRNRTKDVLSVVFALLLGVCCGALTAGAMYLLWFFFSGSNGVSYDSDDFDEDDDDIFNPKKSGYVTIPSEVDATPPKQVDIAIQDTGN